MTMRVIMNYKLDTIKYFLYARKSTDREDKQLQSITDQVHVMKKIAQERGLLIVNILTESQSAKTPDKRPVFTDMIKRIEKGEANGVLCWKINRLSRNPKESGIIQWLLQENKIRSIVTNERQYLPEDNALIFSVESGMANQYSRDLSRDVKRGMKEKAQNGGTNGTARLGYLNFIQSDEKRIVVKDPSRFNLVRKLWNLMLTGFYSPMEILHIANEKWGLRTVKRQKVGGGKLSRSCIYDLLTNLFYAGKIVYEGEVYRGNHPAMVSLEEFDRVQEILGRKGKPRPKTHEFAFTGLVNCGECGCRVTASEKTKLLRTTKESKIYTYYHCTKRKKNYSCSQKPIGLEEFESQIKEEIQKVKILPEFKELALEFLNETNDQEIGDRMHIYENQHKTLADTQKQLDNLTKMRFRELISEEEYIKQRNELKKEIESIQQALRQTEERAKDWLELSENTFNLASYAATYFNNGDLKTKKSILSSLGVNFVLMDQRLEIQLNPWLQPIKSGYQHIKQKYLALEPSLKHHLTDLNYTKSELLNSLRTEWWTVGDSNS